MDIDQKLVTLLCHARDRIIENFKNPSRYNSLTQPYIQKSFTLFSLATSVIVIKQAPFPGLGFEDRMKQITVSSTSNELLETQMNILHLILMKKHKMEFNVDEYAKIEIDFVNFLLDENKVDASLLTLLPSIDNLYFILQHRNVFYPFGTVKAYSILSIWMRESEYYSESASHELSLDNLIKLMRSAATDSEIDEIANAICKFINGHLNAKYLNLNDANTEQLMDILMCVKHISQEYKSNDLRQTAADIMSTVQKCVLKAPMNIKLLINYVDILLRLLRDDNVPVRNRASDIVLEITEKNTNDGALKKGNIHLN